MNCTKLLFILVTLLAASEVLSQQQNYDVIKINNYKCDSKSICNSIHNDIDFKKYTNLIVEVELTSSDALFSSFQFQVIVNGVTSIVVAESKIVIAKNRRLFKLEQSQFQDAKSIQIQYLAGIFNNDNSSVEYSIEIKGIYSDANALINNLPCTFDCSNGKGQCEPLMGICLCKSEQFGEDCSIKGIHIKELISNEQGSQYQLEGNGSISFYLINSNTYNQEQKQELNLKIKIFSGFNLVEYVGLLSLTELGTKQLNPLILEEYQNVKFSLQTIPVDNYFLLTFNNINTFPSSLNVKFTIQDQGAEQDVLNLANSYSIIILTIVILISIVFLLLVFLTVRYVISQYKQKKHIEFQAQQKTLQIDSKIPSQKYEAVVSKYPNIKEINECSVCLDEFNNTDDVRLTLCFHIFHNECFNSWANSSKTKCVLCPVCRRSFQEQEKDVFDYKLKMQASQPIIPDAPQSSAQLANTNNNQVIELPLSAIKQDNADIENQIQPIATFSSANIINEQDNLKINDHEKSIHQEQIENVSQCCNCNEVQI